jgi:hypothetical protein
MNVPQFSVREWLFLQRLLEGKTIEKASTIFSAGRHDRFNKVNNKKGVDSVRKKINQVVEG